MLTDRAFWFRSGIDEHEYISLKKGETHIQKVISNPNLFGETANTVTTTYEKYNEKLGWEGEARRDILSRLKCKGGPRSRFYKSNPDGL